MEDEVRKHVKNIYKSATNSEHSFLHKLKEVSIEIFIIVFAVSLSIWLHNWSEHRHEQKVARNFLTGLRSDLTGDIKQITDNQKIATDLLRIYDTLFSLSPDLVSKKTFDISKYHFIVNIIATRPNIGRFDGFKSSGKMETIENDNLKQNILAYFQQTVPDINVTESFINSLQLKILDQRIDQPNNISDAALLASGKVKTRLSLGMQNLTGLISAYDGALGRLHQIISEINEELKD